MSTLIALVGIPGRVIHQSGTRINPLAHSALPDAEAAIIRNLMQRIDELENAVANLRTEQAMTKSIKGESTVIEGESQNLKDREILELLGDMDEEKEKG